jgi:hypothetical protein
VTAGPLSDRGSPAPEPPASAVPPGGPWPTTGGSPAGRRAFPPRPPRPAYRPPPTRSVWTTAAIVVLVVLTVCGLVLLGMFVLFLMMLNSMGSNK